jgi:uncharacterized protein with FMN-binding domain
MRSFTASKPVIAAFAGLSLVGALAGCAAQADTDTDTVAPDPTTAPSASPSAGSAAASSYKDGTYTESADYQAPSGTETVDVTLTLAGGVVTAVTVTGHATDPQAKIHQGEFASGISAVVVGKNIDELKVDKVGGSSLTSGGFNAAVAEIKTDAAA